MAAPLHLARTAWQISDFRILGAALLAFYVLGVCGVPTITRQPPETVVDEIGIVSSISVEAEGEGPLYYQWYIYIPPAPQQWEPVYRLFPGATNATFTPRNLYVWRSFAVVVSDQSGSVTSRVSTIALPKRFSFTRVSAWPAEGEAAVIELRDFIYKDDTILAATRSNYVEIIDVKDAALPRLVGRFPNPGRAIAIEKEGNIAAVASASLGVDILDITNPQEPLRLATANFGVNVRDLRMVEGRVYAVAASTQEIYPIDIKDPSNPIVHSAYKLARPSYGIAADGDMLYCRTTDSYTRILDASDPEKIVQVGVYVEADVGSLIGAKGKFVFADDAGGASWALDLSRPEAPAFYTTFAYSSGGKAEGDFVVTHRDPGSIEVIDLSTPEQPAPIDWFYGRFYANHISFRPHAIFGGDKVFVAEDDRHLAIYYSLPNAPAIIAQPSDVQRIASKNGHQLVMKDSMEVVGAAPLTYQWYYGESGDTNRPVAGQTSRVLTPVGPGMQGGAVEEYWVHVSNGAGTARSRTIKVKWIPQLEVLASGRLRVYAVRSSSWRIQSSADLRMWIDEGEVTVSSENEVGTAEVTLGPVEGGAKFYRIVQADNP